MSAGQIRSAPEGTTPAPPTSAGTAAADLTALRAEIDAAVASGNFAAARALLVRVWGLAPTAATAPFVVSRFEKLRGHVPLTACKVAVLRSFTVEPLQPLLRAGGFAGGLDLDVRAGDFNTFAQEIVDPASWVYGWGADVVILAAQARDVAPGLWTGFADLSAADVEAHVAQALGQYRQLVGALRSRSAAHLVIHNWQLPPAPAQGLLDARAELGQAAAFRRVNAGLAALAREARNVYVLDYDALVARHGAARWEDPRKWLMVRLPIAADQLVHLAREWLRFLHPITGRVCKCLVTDLDNTLWGGVIGEDGLDGIKLDAGTAGHPYQSLQRALLDLYRRGILLAVASKNNPAEAREAIEKHPGMLLRPDHFAALRINWADKATSLREIAAELNIGLDALAFLDDNPVERAWVREQLPEVTVLELPADPMGFADAVRTSPVFERLALTEEDRERGRMYAEQRVRAELQTSAASLEDFYRSLAMEVEIGPVTPATLARTAQLTQKTNQFNLTTRRYSEEQVSAFAADPACRAYTIKVKDRLGDNGLVGVAITRDDPAAARCEIDTLLLSCRVIGRTVETAFLAHIAGEARARGIRTLAGWYLPTKKNPPARDFYTAHGFKAVAERDGGTLWELDLSAAAAPACPPWIRMTVLPHPPTPTPNGAQGS